MVGYILPEKTKHLCNIGTTSAQRLVRWSNGGALVQWLKLPAWKVWDRGLDPHSGRQVLKKENIFPPLICCTGNVDRLEFRDIENGVVLVMWVD